MNIERIARLITEDPDLINESSSMDYTFEEINIPNSVLPPAYRTRELPKRKTPDQAIATKGAYAGLDLIDQFEPSEHGDFSIDFELEYDVYPGERRTYDYPGSPPELEITDVGVVEVYGPNGEIPLTPELKKWCQELWHEKEDDIWDELWERATEFDYL